MSLQTSSRSREWGFIKTHKGWKVYKFGQGIIGELTHVHINGGGGGTGIRANAHGGNQDDSQKTFPLEPGRTEGGGLQRGMEIPVRRKKGFNTAVTSYQVLGSFVPFSGARDWP